MVKSNQGIIGEQCINNDYGALAVNDEDKKIAWKSYKKLFVTELKCYKNSLEANNIIGPHHLLFFIYFL